MPFFIASKELPALKCTFFFFLHSTKENTNYNAMLSHPTDCKIYPNFRGVMWKKAKMCTQTKLFSPSTYWVPM